MNVESVKSALREFTRTHKTEFTLVEKRESQLLELAAVVGVELHYRSNGYVTPYERLMGYPPDLSQL